MILKSLLTFSWNLFIAWYPLSKLNSLTTLQRGKKRRYSITCTKRNFEIQYLILHQRWPNYIIHILIINSTKKKIKEKNYLSFVIVEDIRNLFHWDVFYFSCYVNYFSSNSQLLLLDEIKTKKLSITITSDY